MEEIWRQIKDYRGYEISNLGRIRSYCLVGGKAGKYGSLGGFDLQKRPRLLNLVEARGYYKISLSKHGFVSQKLVHRLVADAFIPNPNNKLQINHKDGNGLNNVLNNLEWTTSKENTLHSKYILKKCSGENHYRHKLSELFIFCLKKCHAKVSMRHPCILEATLKYNVASCAISQAVSGETWKYINSTNYME